MVGVGILPITMRDGTWWVLMGKQRNTGKKGKSTIDADEENGVWSDFGGKREGKETMLEGAARECAEEMMGVIGIPLDVINWMLTGREIDEEPYKLEIRDCKTKSVSYTSYLVTCEWDEGQRWMNTFNKQRRMMEMSLPKDVIDENSIFEKIEIKWFSVVDMCRDWEIFQKKLRPFYVYVIRQLFTKRVQRELEIDFNLRNSFRVAGSSDLITKYSCRVAGSSDLITKY